EHCPGVAAAVWTAVVTGGLHPICVSASKLYATWGDPEPHQAALRAWLEERTDLWHGVDVIDGRPMVRIGDQGVVAPEPPQPLHPAPQPEPAPAPAAARRPGARWRKLAKDLLPPVITRAIVARNRRRRG
ncbi:class I SAM-dependent methyltransferase, partial [Streptomyces virginiae]